jgi:Carbohydrate esterase, sialic acid-specific acetylesterase
MKTFILLTALLFAPLALLHAAEPPLVLILSGQSNMAGYGKAAELSDEWRTPPPNVTLMNWGGTQPLATGSIGPEVTLAHALARAMPGRQFILFKAAHGGTSQLAW